MINQARTPASVGDNDKVMVANEELMPDVFFGGGVSSAGYITSALFWKLQRSHEFLFFGERKYSVM